MNKSHPFIKGFLLSILLFTSTVMADALPWETETYTHYSEQEPLREMLQAMASALNTTAVISDDIDDVVSVYYREAAPKTILNELSQAHDLMWFYDGEALFVYKKDEAQTGSVTLKHMPVSEFTSTMKKLGIFSDEFYWKELEEESLIQFKGPERFVTSVLQMAKIVDVPRTSHQKVYKWVDTKGVVNFSSRNPNKGRTDSNTNVTVLTKDNLYAE